MPQMGSFFDKLLPQNVWLKGNKRKEGEGRIVSSPFLQVPFSLNMFYFFLNRNGIGLKFNNIINALNQVPCACCFGLARCNTINRMDVFVYTSLCLLDINIVLNPRCFDEKF